ncbi:MAG: PAS domain S-box protein [Terriglobia bacterium]
MRTRKRIVHPQRRKVALRSPASAEAPLGELGLLSDVLGKSLQIDIVLAEILSRCFKVVGASTGAAYLARSDGRLSLTTQIGYPDSAREALADFFGHFNLLERAMKEGEPVAVPSAWLTRGRSRDLLGSLRAKSLLLLPIALGQERLGVLVMASAQGDLAEKLSLLTKTVRLQLGQAIAVARAISLFAASEQRFRDLVQQLDAIVWEAEAQTCRFSFVSRRAEDILGYPIEQWLAEPDFWARHIHPEDRETAVAICQNATAAGRDHTFEYRALAADGRVLWLRNIVRVVRDEEGRVRQLRGLMVDITERKQAEEALRSIAEGTSSVTGGDFFHSLVRHLASALQVRYAFVAECTDWKKTRVRTLAFWTGTDFGENVEYDVAGTPCDKVVGGTMCYHPEGAQGLFPRDKDLVELRVEGYLGMPLFDSAGHVLGHLAVMDDKPMGDQPRGLSILKIFAARAGAELERKQAEEALRFTQFSIDRTADAAFWMGPDGKLNYVNDAACRALGYSRDELLSMSVHDIDPDFPADLWPVHWRGVKQAGSLTFYSRHRAKDGRIIPVEITANYLEFGGKEYNCAFARDITERMRSEQALRRSEASYRSLIEGALYGIYRSSMDGRFLQVNPALVAMLGYQSQSELLAVDMGTDIYRLPGERARLVEQYRNREKFEGVEVEWKRKDGTSITVWLSGRPVRDEQGKEAYFEGIVENVTERRLLEQQLRQAQKMEAVGRLAGGIAHDFNNLLMVIGGHTELLLDRVGESESLRRNAKEIQKAAARAATQTQQLLAFSRRQVLQTEVLDLNAVVADMEQMLRRVIGEHIDLVTIPDPALGQVRADPGQVEQVLMNLVLNARDAMPRGGRLTLETANLELDEIYVRRHPVGTPGLYVMLAVSDTGVGMDKEVQAHIFEPFFTTKEKGKGSGLGLSTVYGIIKQSGGYIWAYSEPGRGTTFKIYLPRVGEKVTVPKPLSVPPEPKRGSETIMVVEDETAVRELAGQFLENCGYTVLQAKDAAEALLEAGRHTGPIHLLLTDVVMPGASGRELARCLAARRPQMKVLFISGYTGEAIANHGLLAVGTAFLPKPFTREALTRKVREVLEAEKGLQLQPTGSARHSREN